MMQLDSMITEGFIVSSMWVTTTQVSELLKHSCPRALHTINAEHSVAVLTGKTTNVLRVDWSTEKR